MTGTDIEMFHRLGIGEGIIQRAGIVRVSDREARDQYGIRGNGDMQGVAFPYYSADGDRRLSARVRRDNPDIEDGKPRGKYMSAWGDRRHGYIVRGCGDLVADKTVPVVLVEAEKSALAILEWSERTGQKLLPIGLGGCWAWKCRIGKTEGPSGERVDEYGIIEANVLYHSLLGLTN